MSTMANRDFRAHQDRTSRMIADAEAAAAAAKARMSGRSGASTGAGTSGAPTPSYMGDVKEFANWALSVGQAAASSTASATKSAVQQGAQAGLAMAGQAQAQANRLHYAALDQMSPGWRETLAQSKSAVSDVSALSKHFNDNILPQALANARQVSDAMHRNVTSMLAGNIPEDVDAQVRRRAAETALRFGIGGDSGRALEARDLGLTSLDMMKEGHKLAPAASSLLPDFLKASQGILGDPVGLAQGHAQSMAALAPRQLDPSGLISGMASAYGSATASSAFDPSRILGTALQYGTTVADTRHSQHWMGQAIDQYRGALGAMGGSLA